jgi:hypothetical protein
VGTVSDPNLIKHSTERKNHETCPSFPKPVALSQELQTDPNCSNPTGRKAEPCEPCVPPVPRRSLQ